MTTSGRVATTAVDERLLKRLPEENDVTGKRQNDPDESSADIVLTELQDAVREHELILRKQEDLIRRLRDELGGVKA